MSVRSTPRRRNDTSPAANGSKIRELIARGEGAATLYRTIAAGPSGQRASRPVGVVRYLPDGPDEFRIIDPRDGSGAGWARRTVWAGEWWWSITDEKWDGGRTWLGYAETLSLGVDVLFNGVHAATGRHDSARTSPAVFRTADSVHEQNAREHVAGCKPCRDAGKHGGWMDCVAR